MPSVIILPSMCPLLDSTKGMINAVSIAKMKEGVVILNFARDLLANEKDVLARLCRAERLQSMYLILQIPQPQV